MNLNKFTEKAQEAVLASPQLASELNHAQVEPEHLLVTLLEQPDGVVPTVLQKLNADPAATGARASRPPRPPAESVRRRRAESVAAAARRPRCRAGGSPLDAGRVSTEHLLLGSSPNLAVRRPWKR